jgi:hypothetical protein
MDHTLNEPQAVGDRKVSYRRQELIDVSAGRHLGTLPRPRKNLEQVPGLAGTGQNRIMTSRHDPGCRHVRTTGRRTTMPAARCAAGAVCPAADPVVSEDLYASLVGEVD